MPLKSWAWKYCGHEVRVEIWWRLSGWRRERVYIDHDLCAQRRGYSLGSVLRCCIKNDTGGEDQLEIRFRRSLWVRSPVFQIAAGPLRCQVLVKGRPWQWEPDQVRLEKIWIYGESDDGFPGGQVNPPWSLLIFPLLLVYGVVFFPLLVCLASLAEYIKELRLKSKLRRRGRVVDWVDVKRRLGEGSSTLIVEVRFLRSVQFWWTEEDVLARSPFPPSHKGEFWFPGGGTENPFREWCYYHYLSDDTGKALQTSAPTGEDEKVLSKWRDRTSPNELPSAWKAAYPRLQVVATGFGPYSKKTAAAFALTLGEGGDDSIPRLAAALQGKDRHLRRLAVNALRMMGPSAQKAMPALIEQLYYGSVGERINVADAVAAIGGGAIEQLREASNHDDPWVRCAADYALTKLGLAQGSPQSLIRQFQKRFLTRERFFTYFCSI